MLTATEARRLAGPTVAERVESLLSSVKAEAEKGNRCLKTGWTHKEDSDLWENGGYHSTEEWQKAKEILEKLGYKVTFYYNEASQFVDMYTLVEW